MGSTEIEASEDRVAIVIASALGEVPCTHQDWGETGEDRSGDVGSALTRSRSSCRVWRWVIVS